MQTVSEQLIPFVQQVTRDYLRENGKICPDNPLTFRNPTGYNHHGLTAATIMEVCLKAMGYTTKLMGRSDLEPKVTLATAHNVVMVIAENGVRYLVDPSYIQFHKDICIDSSLLPTNPILILAEGAEEAYIERTIISQWKDNQESFQEGNSATKESLERNGQILPYIIDQINLPLNTRPRDVCGWVTDAFARVWGLPGYQPIIFNRSFHEIFHGTGRVRNTYEMIKTMKIDQLTDRLSLTEVEERLKTLKKNPALHGKNSHEALSLISQLPKDSRKNYISLLDCDSRLQRYSGMDASLSVYLRSLKKVVNPEGKDLKVVYGCSGADSTTVLLATDAQDLTFVDLTRLSYDSFKQALDLIRRNDPLTNHAIQQRFNEDSFLTMRANYGGTSSGCKEDGSHEMKEIALKLMFELREIGVNLQDVTIEHLEQDKAIRIEFPWSYQEGQSPRRRYLTLLTADITSFESYPSLLKSKLESGIDVFYMKGSIQAPLKYPQFLPYLAQSIHPGGWLMTADKTFLMEAVDPQPCLISNELSFREQETEEITSLKELMQLSMNPLGNIQSLEFYPPHLRHLRNPGSDLSYWSFLTLRQKQEVEREVKP